MTDNLYFTHDLSFGVLGTVPVENVTQYAQANGHTTEQAGGGFNLVITTASPINNPIIFIDLSTSQQFIAFPTHRPH